jgi:16S rRNA (guanine527-N7)-methyltransferase
MFAQILDNALQQNAIKLDPPAQNKLCQYLELLRTWNNVFNLTRITQPHDMVYLHIIDSLVLNPLLKGNRLLDVGSGAGLPGIPLAILNPEQEWTLLDKNRKKIHFLTQSIAELELRNVKVVHDACENFHPHLSFDTIIARAFGTLRLLLENTEHLLDRHGIFLAMKGKYPQEELEQIPKGFKVQYTRKLEIKGINHLRHVVCLAIEG